MQTDLKKTPQPPIKKLEAKLLPGEFTVPSATASLLFLTVLFVTNNYVLNM